MDKEFVSLFYTYKNLFQPTKIVCGVVLGSVLLSKISNLSLVDGKDIGKGDPTKGDQSSFSIKINYQQKW